MDKMFNAFFLVVAALAIVIIGVGIWAVITIVNWLVSL